MFSLGHSASLFSNLEFDMLTRMNENIRTMEISSELEAEEKQRSNMKEDVWRAMPKHPQPL